MSGLKALLFDYADADRRPAPHISDHHILRQDFFLTYHSSGFTSTTSWDRNHWMKQRLNVRRKVFLWSTRDYRSYRAKIFIGLKNPSPIFPMLEHLLSICLEELYKTINQVLERSEDYVQLAKVVYSSSKRILRRFSHAWQRTFCAHAKSWVQPLAYPSRAENDPWSETPWESLPVSTDELIDQIYWCRQVSCVLDRTSTN